MTYTRDIIVVALPFGKKTIPDLPCKDGWTLAFIVGNAFHYARGGHSWLGSTNGTRLDRASLIVPAKKKRWKKKSENLTCHKGRDSTALTDWLSISVWHEIWDYLVKFLRLSDISSYVQHIKLTWSCIPCSFLQDIIFPSCQLST